jgi:hypothetical protein
MSLDARYQLYQPIPGTGKTRTFRAFEMPGAREVMVHLLDPDTPAIDRQIQDLPPAKRSLILAQGLHSGVSAVVTEVLLPGVTLSDWLKPAAGNFAPTQLLSQMKVPPVPAAPAGEITKMINPSGSALPTQAIPQMPPSDGSSPTKTLPQMKAAPPPGSEAVDITRLLNPAGSSLPTQAVPQITPPAAGPGAFTQMFEEAGIPAAPPVPAKPPVSAPAKPASAPVPQPNPAARQQTTRPRPVVPANPNPAPGNPASKPAAKGTTQARPVVPAAPRQSNYLPLIYAMAGAIIALLVVVLYLTRR